ncbi:DEKNAAC103013 [Brettanomyces naardenensis]|uniref:DEKNAAC103013 n=1 Tax=Brettanomyces naardenensis TaxID=13370 RepID=A0A448YM53_BRENA|nr:DEKNAAC103013 [Brettanomyces naardenensis]
MSFQPINPKPFLQSLVNKQVVVKLKFNDIEYHGKLLSIDNYMNLLLDKDAQEVNSKTSETSPLGDELFIRCNNVLWVSEEKVEEGEGKAKSEEVESEKVKDKHTDSANKDDDAEMS